MIEVKNIAKSFNGVPVLKNIDVLFEKGKTNLIIGQSGSGKTVLLKSIVGLHDIEQGKVIFDGTVFNELNFKDKKEMRKQIGMLFQGGALFDSATVEENVISGGFGSSVLRLLAEHSLISDFKMLGLPDAFVEHGTQAQLRHESGLDAAGIKKEIKQMVKGKGSGLKLHASN